MTTHMNAKKGDFAETCLVPGDPLRAKVIAEKYLENVKQVTDVRNMLGFTGTYQGVPVSVMGTGMGPSSATIYIHELIQTYGVKNLIRIGTAGAISSSLKKGQLYFAQGACSDNVMNRIRFKGYEYAPIADFHLLRTAMGQAEKRGLEPRVGNVFSSDFFYHPDESVYALCEKFNVPAIEMECSALYGTCAELGARGLGIVTISNELYGEHHELTPEERQTTLDDMVYVALGAAVELHKAKEAAEAKAAAEAPAAEEKAEAEAKAAFTPPAR